MANSLNFAEVFTPAFDTWRHYQLPNKQPTEFSFTYRDGRSMAAVVANASASLLRQLVRVEAANLAKINAPGSVIINPRTDRIRKIVVESGSLGLSRWHYCERNIRADYEKAFVGAPGALVGIGIMTDTDNTQSQARAWYGPLHLSAAK